MSRSMSPIEQVLQDEVTHLLDWLATTVTAGSLGEARTARTTLAARLDEAEGRLAAAREALLEDYGRWRRALEDVENLWALAAWRSATAEEAVEQPAALAA